MHFLVLLGASLAGTVVAMVLLVRALKSNRGWLRRAAFLACAGAVSVHVWGMLHVLGAVAEAEDGGTGSFPIGPCREAGEQIASRVVGYDVGYVWLSFSCRLSDGGRHTTSTVPGYVNPAWALLGLTALVLAVVPAERADRRMPRERQDS